jgi:hypothetical protein
MVGRSQRHLREIQGYDSGGNKNPGSGGGPGPGPGLQLLTLDNVSFTQSAIPGTPVGTISGKSAGTKLELTGTGGKLMLDTARTHVLVGLLASKEETINATLTEYNETTGETRATNVAFNCGGLTALDLAGGSQGPIAVWSVERPPSITSGVTSAFTIRNSANAQSTLVYDNTTGKLVLTSFPGTGDGVSFHCTKHFDTSGAAHDLTTAVGPKLIFEGNFATLTVLPGLSNAGSGYTPNDVLTENGTNAVLLVDGVRAQIRVLTVSGGGGTGPIATYAIERAGKYYYGPGGTNAATTAVAFSGGTGTGATFTMPLTSSPTNTYTNDKVALEFVNLGGTNLKSAGFLNVGGTNNLAILAVVKRMGYSGGAVNPQPRPGAPTTSAKSVFLGYGTLATQILITSSAISAQNATSQADPTGYPANFNRDSLLGKTMCAYDLPDDLPIDETAPAPTNEWTNIWINQVGSKISAGGDTRRHYADRDHGVAETLAAAVTVGAAGNSGAQFNGRYKEIVIFQSATPMTNDEVQRKSIGQRNRFALTADTVVRDRYMILFTGQSNAVSHLSHTTSGDNVDTTTQSAQRRIRAKVVEGLGITTPERVLFGLASRTCVGGTWMLKHGKVGTDPDNPTSWWNEDIDDWGPLALGLAMTTPTAPTPGSGYVVGDLVSPPGGTLIAGGEATQLRVETINGSGGILTLSLVKAGAYSAAPTVPFAPVGGSGTGASLTGTYSGGLVPYLDILKKFKNRRLVIVHAQGEADSTNTLDDALQLVWGQKTYLFLDKIRNYCGQPDAPIIIQPLARYGGAAGSARRNRVNGMRRVQTTYLGAQYNVFIAADTGIAARAAGAGASDAPQFDAHLGAMYLPYGYNPATGGPEDGYQNVGWRDAKAILHGLKMAYSKDLLVNDNWRGPRVVAATRVSNTIFDLEVQFPVGCGGSALSSFSGTLSGVRAWLGSTEYLPTSVAVVTAGGKTYLRSTFPSALPANVNIAYEANYIPGGEYAAPTRNHIVDNNAEIAMPLETSLALAA